MTYYCNYRVSRWVIRSAKLSYSRGCICLDWGEIGTGQRAFSQDDDNALCRLDLIKFFSVVFTLFNKILTSNLLLGRRISCQRELYSGVFQWVCKHYFSCDCWPEGIINPGSRWLQPRSRVWPGIRSCSSKGTTRVGFPANFAAGCCAFSWEAGGDYYGSAS
jgi:hypothetical protein